MHSFEIIWIKISDLSSLGSWSIKGTDDSTLIEEGFIGSFDENIFQEKVTFYRFIYFIHHSKYKKNNVRIDRKKV